MMIVGIVHMGLAKFKVIMKVVLCTRVSILSTHTELNCCLVERCLFYFYFLNDIMSMELGFLV